MGEPIQSVGQLAGICIWNDPDWIKVLGDSDGHIQLDVVSVALPTGAATAANQTTIINAMTRCATAPTIYNVTMTTADTEYSQALPADTKKFTVKCRGEYDVKLCFTSSGSGTLYLTIPSGQNYWEDGLMDESITLYFQCATAAQVLEIVAWS